MLKTTAFWINISARSIDRSINSIRLLLSGPITSLLLRRSIRYLAYLVACMATIRNLPTGRCPSLPTARRERRQSEPGRLSHCNPRRDSIDACLSQGRVANCAHTPRTGLQAMCDGARANPICLRGPRCRCIDEGSRNFTMGAVELVYPATG